MQRPSGGSQGTLPSTFHRKLRLFSGRVPVPHGEVDYVSWRMKVSQIQTDDDDLITDGQLKRIILESLQRPALDTLRNSTGSSTEVLEVLDTLYGSVEDGQELLIQFFNTYQHDKEIASAYLQRIYLQIMDVADKNGTTINEVPRHLVRQFGRGSHDENIIQKRGLSDQIEEPPSFAELLLSIRKEEARRTEKRLRMKAGRVAVQNISPVASPKAERSSCDDKKLVAELTCRLAAVESQLKQHQAGSLATNSATHCRQQDARTPASGGSHSLGSRGKSGEFNKRRSWRRKFCYRCGEDDHLANHCSKKKNPELVQQKLLGSGN